MSNCTTVMEFFLLGFSEVWVLQLVHVTLFLLVYLAALMVNFLIVAVTALDRHLHTPMYFFLRNLSILDLCYISFIVPNSIFNSLTDRRSISFLGSVLQVLFFTSFASSEIALLIVMSYDSYVATCCPLYYEVIMSPRALMRLSSYEDMLQEVGVCTFLTLLSLICFMFIGVSYVHIFWAMLKMPSVEATTSSSNSQFPPATFSFLLQPPASSSNP
ncbi:olfactory receptor 14I1-like [Tachyglossus aculeatus]|uniref:olfactory receptor 14I1-like n=1 Tax=Tachyglossus aculeatus TaxID=9261 RepID=UPI0018F52420|nr:olfactory receptor 14I1-like [Tachyglossus aculeatus]